MIDLFRSRLTVSSNVFQVVFVHMVSRNFGMVLFFILLTCRSHFNLHLISYLSTVSTFNSSKFIHSVTSRGSLRPSGHELRSPRPDGKRHVLFRPTATYKISVIFFLYKASAGERLYDLRWHAADLGVFQSWRLMARGILLETTTQSTSLLGDHCEKHRLPLRSPFLLFILL